MTNISYYDPRLLLTTIENLPPTHTFLRDTFFGGAARTFFTEKVDVEYRKGRRKMAPFVHPKLGGKAMSREGYKVQTFAPASVKPKMVLDVEDLMVKGFGENIYSNRKPSERAAEIIARDMATMNDSIVRREEWMAAQILTTGRVDIIGEGIDSFLDFDFDNKKTLSGTSLWNHENSDVLRDIRQWRLSIIQKSGITPNMLLVSEDVAEALLRNEKLLKLLDNRRVQLGQLNVQELPNGVTYHGDLSAVGVGIYSYNEWYVDDESDGDGEKPMIPEKTAILASTNQQSSILYGGVTLANPETGRFTTYEGARIPDTWINKDPDVRFMQIHSKPLPVPHEVDSWLVAKVL